MTRETGIILILCLLPIAQAAHLAHSIRRGWIWYGLVRVRRDEDPKQFRDARRLYVVMLAMECGLLAIPLVAKLLGK